MGTKVLAVFFTVIISSCRPEETCKFAKDDCKPEPNLCKLECSNESGNGSDDCKFDPDAKTCTSPTPMPQFNDMKAAACKSLCDSETNCFYYRYEHREASKTKFCYIMDATQCEDFGEGCEPNCQGPQCEPSCQSGIADKNDCDDNNGVPVFEHECLSQSPTHTPGIMPDFKLHWTCYTPSGDEHDIYGTAKAPANTKCTAKPECIKDGKNQNYKYTCVPDQTQPVDPKKGKWEWEAPVPADQEVHDPDLVEEGKLKEPTCNAKDLVVADYANQITLGMEILCVEKNDAGSTPSSDGKIEAQNSCLLFCDGYPILNFYTKKTDWVFTYIDDSAENTIDDPEDTESTIFCHNSS